MGIYDRDYYRRETPGFSVGAPRSVITWLVLINVAIWLANGIFTPQTNGIMTLLELRVGSLLQPWMWWRFVTYGFDHSPVLNHVLVNMLTLWFLGRDIERLYGGKEFLRLYLVLLVVAGVTWAGFELVKKSPLGLPAVGASGAVAGIVMLYALNFPRRMLLVMFVIPMPAWAVGTIIVLYDVLGASGHSIGDPHVAFTAHLGGAAFAYIYFQQRWNFGRLLPAMDWWTRLRRPKLRIEQPPSAEVPEEEVDRILEKISREGEEKLTRKERRILRDASREYQKRRRGE